MVREELDLLQALSLDLKVAKTVARIREAVSYYGKDGMYLSYSGGLDSTVLKHLLDKLYDNKIPSVYARTGLDFPELVDHVKSQENVIIVEPLKTFPNVIKENGYPVISKSTAMKVMRLRDQTGRYKCAYQNFILGKKKNGEKVASATLLPKKDHYLLDAPFKISHECCYFLKEGPLINYSKETGRRPFMATRTDESDLRASNYLKTGCNLLTCETNRGYSKPLSFWTRQDILTYIKLFDIPYPKVYGDIVMDEKGALQTTGEIRTGCMYCLFGVAYDAKESHDGLNRIQRLNKTHPKIYDYCLNTLGLKEVMDYINIPY